MVTMAPARLARKCTESRLHGQKGPVQVYGQYGVPIRQVIWASVFPRRRHVDEMSRRPKHSTAAAISQSDGGRIAYVGQ